MAGKIIYKISGAGCNACILKIKNIFIFSLISQGKYWTKLIF